MSKVIAILRTKTGLTKDDLRAIDSLRVSGDDEDAGEIVMVYADSSAVLHGLGSGVEFPIRVDDEPDPVADAEELIQEIYGKIMMPIHKILLRRPGEGTAIGCYMEHIPFKIYLRICDFFNKSYNEKITAENVSACRRLMEIIDYTKEHKSDNLDEALAELDISEEDYNRWMTEITA